ncbi:MAG: glycogen synthase [Bowdeniella nasicola]|nr:glycogen synthase [Bowdeniella nasicola]
MSTKEKRVDLLTREYPPHVYGGAGVHVAELSRVLRPHLDIRVHAFDGPRTAPDTPPGVRGYDDLPQLADANATLKTLGVDLLLADGAAGTDLVHSHTWYANMAGHLAKLLYDVPHVLSAHSLEPLRPWKAEQLGGGYRISSWVEKTAYEHADAVIAVSGGMREDILRCYPRIDPERVHVVHNGIDLDTWREPTDLDHRAQVLSQWGIDDNRPTVVFVGRITRQKGLPYLLRAIKQLPRDIQVVLCAGAADTPEILEEVSTLVKELQTERDAVHWIAEMLPREDLIAILSAGTCFVTPSIYEPLGIVNLEAMAVGLPVVGTATGGIPEVIDDEVTGLLVPIDQVSDGTGTPKDPQRFVNDLAAALSEMLADEQRCHQMGIAARQRVEEFFSWEAIAERTLQVYQSVWAKPVE